MKQPVHSLQKKSEARFTFGRRDFLCTLSAAAAALALPGFASAQDVKEAAKAGLNIVFILIDDLGWADTSCYGRKTWKTPNIDRLASSGLRFTQAYAAGPVCSPTRASILTGKYPARLHITDWIPGKIFPKTKLRAPDFQMNLPLEEVTIAEALKAKGYVTCIVGKWHVNDAVTQAPHISATQQGFDAAIQTDGGPRFIGPNKRFNDDVKGDEALRWLEENRKQPFFLLFSTNAVHAPIEAHPDLVRKYRDLGLDEAMASYAGMVEHVDQNVGRIMRKLDELKLADNTAVIFFSDNGGKLPFTSNLPLRGGKGELYEGGIRDPLIVRWPGVTKAGTTCDAPVISTDFYPTLLAMAGAPMRPEQHLDGRSLASLCGGQETPSRAAFFWHYPHYNFLGASVPASAVRQGDWKLIEFLEDKRVELYNVKDDIGETRDLAAKEPARAESMRKLLAEWRQSVGAQMPTVNPGYDPNFVRRKKKP